MTKLAETYFRLDIRLPAEDLEKLRGYLEKRASVYYAEGLFNQSPEFAVYVEDGSVRGWLVVAGALYLGIGQYGSFRAGLDYVVHDARTFSERVLEEIRGAGLSDSEIGRLERRLGVPGQLRRLFRRLDRLEKHGHELSAPDHKREVNSIARSFNRVLKSIDNDRDQALVIEYLSSEIREALPEPGPPSQYPHIPRAALRPEGFNVERGQLLVPPIYGGDAQRRRGIEQENRYQISTSPSGLHLTRK